MPRSKKIGSYLISFLFIFEALQSQQLRFSDFYKLKYPGIKPYYPNFIFPLPINFNIPYCLINNPCALRKLFLKAKKLPVSDSMNHELMFPTIHPLHASLLDIFCIQINTKSPEKRLFLFRFKEYDLYHII